MFAAYVMKNTRHTSENMILGESDGVISQY